MGKSVIDRTQPEVQSDFPVLSIMQAQTDRSRCMKEKKKKKKKKKKKSPLFSQFANHTLEERSTCCCTASTRIPAP